MDIPLRDPNEPKYTPPNEKKNNKELLTELQQIYTEPEEQDFKTSLTMNTVASMLKSSSPRDAAPPPGH